MELSATPGVARLPMKVREVEQFSAGHLPRSSLAQANACLQPLLEQFSLQDSRTSRALLFLVIAEEVRAAPPQILFVLCGGIALEHPPSQTRLPAPERGANLLSDGQSRAPCKDLRYHDATDLRSSHC